MKYSYLLLLVFLLVGISACSQGQTGVTPDIPTTDRSVNEAGRQLWGLYDVSIDPDTLQAIAIPARTAELRMNINTFMNPNPALIKLKIIDGTKLKTTGELVMDVSLTHPVNKPKLAGFDVHCILLSNGTNWLNYDSSLIYPVVGSNTVLLNSDGYSRWYNAVDFTTPGAFGYKPGALGNVAYPQATLNGYKMYADGMSTTDNAAFWLTSNQANRGIFTPGSTNKRRWDLQFQMSGGKPVVKFQYAVVASWAMPSVDNPTPADFPATANIQEASGIKIDSSQSTLYHTDTKSGGNLVLNIDVFDWQGGTNIQDQVSRIIIESDVLNDSLVVNDPILTQNAGAAFATYSAIIPSDHVDSNDDVAIWVAVESASPTNYLNVPTATYPTTAKLSAFQLGHATVADVAPAAPPLILSGVDIDSGTTMCPDRSSDNAAVFSVQATGDLPLTYTWNIIIARTLPIGKVPGYSDVHGDGAGHLSVDFTKSAFASIPETLSVACTVSDGVNPPVSAVSLQIFLDCVLFHADLNGFSSFDNFGWQVVDSESSSQTRWSTNAATPAGVNLNGKGALWQNNPDFSNGVAVNSKGMLLSAPVNIPAFLTSAFIEVKHSYSFDPITMGGNIKVGSIGSLTTVTIPPRAIASGQGYDGDLTDGTNPMYPQSVFSASGASGTVLSSLNVPPSLIGGIMEIGFAAASGAVAIPDGGWLIDDVKVIGQL